MNSNILQDGITEDMTSSSGQNYFSSSIDLDWHNSPEGRGVMAHLTDQTNGQRRNYGKSS